MEGRGWLVALACATICMLFGCNGQLPPRAEEILSSGYQAYENGDDREATRQMDIFLRDYDGYRGDDRAYYLRGLTRYRLKNLSGAKADLNAAISRSQDKALRAKALLALGDLAYGGGDMALAENMYRQALADIIVKEPPADKALYMLGCVLQRQGRWGDANVQLNKLIYHFPGSKAAGNAGRKVHCRAWTVQAGAFHNKRHADASAGKLKAGGMSAKREPIIREGQLWHVVHVGRYATYEQAAAALPGVRRYSKESFVTVTR